jgi:hypothetical protein
MMTKREALKTVLLDVLSDPSFEEDLIKERLLSRAMPLSQMGKEAQKTISAIKKHELVKAYSLLFGGD